LNQKKKERCKVSLLFQKSEIKEYVKSEDGYLLWIDLNNSETRKDTVNFQRLGEKENKVGRNKKNSMS
jgi:hypothetical protein